MQLAEKLDVETTLCRLGQQTVPPLSDFDQIIVGGSIHIGKIQKLVSNFLIRERHMLLSKPLGLFICCMAEGEKSDQQLEDAFPADLLTHASARANFGGCFNFSRMSWMNRKMVQMVVRQETGRDTDLSKDINKIRPEAIDAFATMLTGVE